jgi:hypothetical protein
MTAALAPRLPTFSGDTGHPPADVIRPNLRAIQGRRRAAQAYASELKILAADHRANGIVMDPHAFATAFAMVRASATSGCVVRIVTGEHSSLVHRWQFLGSGDLHEAVARDLRDIGLPDDFRVVERACEAVERENAARRSCSLPKGDALARMFGVTYAERQELGLKCIGAIDVPKVDRLALASERKLERTAHAWRASAPARCPGPSIGRTAQRPPSRGRPTGYPDRSGIGDGRRPKTTACRVRK